MQDNISHVHSTRQHSKCPLEACVASQPSTHVDLDLPLGLPSGRAPTTGHIHLTVSLVWQWTKQSCRGCHPVQCAPGREQSAWHTFVQALTSMDENACRSWAMFRILPCPNLSLVGRILPVLPMLELLQRLGDVLVESRSGVAFRSVDR